MAFKKYLDRYLDRFLFKVTYNMGIYYKRIAEDPATWLRRDYLAGEIGQKAIFRWIFRLPPQHNLQMLKLFLFKNTPSKII